MKSAGGYDYDCQKPQLRRADRRRRLENTSADSHEHKDTVQKSMTDDHHHHHTTTTTTTNDHDDARPCLNSWRTRWTMFFCTDNSCSSDDKVITLLEKPPVRAGRRHSFDEKGSSFAIRRFLVDDERSGWSTSTTRVVRS